jgi:hypothetical protein
LIPLRCIFGRIDALRRGPAVSRWARAGTRASVVMQTMIQTARARFLFISHSSSSNNVTVIRRAAA